MTMHAMYGETKTRAFSVSSPCIVDIAHDIFPFFCYDGFMTILQSFLFGALQGVTEFLPISSSGHLAVAQHLFSLGDVPLLFDVFLHLSGCARRYPVYVFRRSSGKRSV